jgi:hypothetical protein
MAWARRMHESPNPSENEEPGARLGRISPSECKKQLPGLSRGAAGEAGDALSSRHKKKSLDEVGISFSANSLLGECIVCWIGFRVYPSLVKNNQLYSGFETIVKVPCFA